MWISCVYITSWCVTFWARIRVRTYVKYAIDEELILRASSQTAELAPSSGNLICLFAQMEHKEDENSIQLVHFELHCVFYQQQRDKDTDQMN